MLKGQAVEFEGEQLTAKLALDIPDASSVPLLVAALGPAMLKLANENDVVGMAAFEKGISPSLSPLTPPFLQRRHVRVAGQATRRGV